MDWSSVHPIFNLLPCLCSPCGLSNLYIKKPAINKVCRSGDVRLVSILLRPQTPKPRDNDILWFIFGSNNVVSSWTYNHNSNWVNSITPYYHWFSHLKTLNKYPHLVLQNTYQAFQLTQKTRSKMVLIRLFPVVFSASRSTSSNTR